MEEPGRLLAPLHSCGLLEVITHLLLRRVAFKEVDEAHIILLSLFLDGLGRLLELL